MLRTGEYLQLIQDTLQYLKQNPEAVLSSADDCANYRQAFKASMARGRIQVAPSPPRLEPVKINSSEPTPSTCEASPEIPSFPREQLINPSPVPKETRNLTTESIEKSMVPSFPRDQPIAPSPVPKETRNLTTERTEEALPNKPVSSNSNSASVGLTNTPNTVSNDSLQWPILPFGKWKTLLSKVAPEVHILSDVPNDAIAKKIATRWKTKNLSAPITLLCYQEIPEQKALLEQIAIALDVHFAPAKLVSAETIEKEQQWETFLSVDALKLVIACDYTLWQMPGLLKFYKEATPKRLLGEKELFLLPDLSLYLKDPLLKRSLWKALCQICEPLLPPSF